MKIMFEWQEQYLSSERSERVRYCSCHSNIKFISSRHRVIFLLYGPPTIHSKDYSHIWNFFFVHMIILQTVAMATNNLKDNHFLLCSTYLLPFLELASVKYFETR